MKITHIYHSGFMVEMEQSVLLFDWYTGRLPAIPADKRLYVFCSHAHEDHYSAAIWNLQRDHRRIVYILDEGITDAVKHTEAEVLTVAPHRSYETHDIRVRTLASTDMGVAFYVEAEGKRIYHAGDLNIWYWYDEPMEDNIASEKKCREEMQSLADSLRADKGDAANAAPAGKEVPAPEASAGGRRSLLDIAFVPLDPRLRREAPRCLAAFMEILGAAYVFPMHYWGQEEETRAYLSDPRIRPYAEQIHFEEEYEVR